MKLTPGKYYWLKQRGNKHFRLIGKFKEKILNGRQRTFYHFTEVFFIGRKYFIGNFIFKRKPNYKPMTKTEYTKVIKETLKLKWNNKKVRRN